MPEPEDLRTLAAIEAMPAAERTRLLALAEVVIARDRLDPTRERLVFGGERLAFIVHMGQPMDASVLRVMLELDGEEPERLRALVLVAHAAMAADDEEPEDG